MRYLILLLMLTSLPGLSSAVDLEKFGLTYNLNLNWNTSGFNDTYRLYTLRKDIEGNRRPLQYLNTFGIAYRHITEGGILVQSNLSFGDYHFDENRKMGLVSSLLISQYTFRPVQRYASFSAFQSFEKGQNIFVKSASLGLLFAFKDDIKGTPLHGFEIGIGFSIMHVEGSFIPGINLRTNSWKL